MFSNLSVSDQDTSIDYPITDSKLPFGDYISQCRKIIAERRTDLEAAGSKAETIISANCPFEYAPPGEASPKHGALLIHGLLDCPFSFQEIGRHLQGKGILARSILLPGHGTTPTDLMHTSYHDWIQAVRYGVESLKKEVESVYLVGYSTGAALSIYHALQDNSIAGIILLSPAIKVRAPVDLAAYWYYMTNYYGKNKNWVYVCDEIDYTKYRSIAFNAVRQVSKITETVRNMSDERIFHTPMYMILSREDETISSHHAIDFFSTMRNTESKMLLYSSSKHSYPDQRIQTRNSVYPELNVKHLSHPSLPFSADNPHYGNHGDYINAARTHEKSCAYGAFNRVEVNLYNILMKTKLTKLPRRELTYNPDFIPMADSIADFIKR